MLLVLQKHIYSWYIIFIIHPIFCTVFITNHASVSPIQNLGLTILLCNSYDVFTTFLRSLSSEKDSNKY